MLQVRACRSPYGSVIAIHAGLSIALTMASLSGCSRGAQPPASRANIASFGSTVTDAEHVTYASELIRAITDGRTAPILDKFDYRACLDASLEGLPFSGSGRQAFETGFMNSLTQSRGGMAELVDAVAADGSFRLLRVVSNGSPKRARFRVVMGGEGGVNYLDFVLSRRDDGRVRAVDFYNFSTGEYFSQSIRRTAMMAAAEENRGILTRLAARDQSFINNASKVSRMAQEVQEGAYLQAIETYRSMPEPLRKEKLLLVLRLKAAMAVSNTEYGYALEDYRRLFPNDPSTALVSIDHFALKKQFTTCQDLIDQLDLSIGGDPYLNVLRTGFFIEAKRFVDALRTAKAGVKELPDLADTHFALISACLAAKRFDPIPGALDTLETKFHVEFQDMNNVPEYAGFVRSAAYKTWKSRRSH